MYLLSLLRLIQPNLLLPATTALGTIRPDGRERGLQAGANVVMPNLSPLGCEKNMHCTTANYVPARRLHSASRLPVAPCGVGRLPDCYCAEILSDK